MDARAHLLSLGWAGPGHSLDSRPHKGRRGLAYDPKQVQSTGNGLIKPLLISQKKNTFGIGKKAHEPAAGNEWWLKGFEAALGNVGKTDSERTSGTVTPESKGSSSGYKGKHVGLYGHFVKGQQMQGTVGESLDSERKTKKRKSDTFDESADTASSGGESVTEKPHKRHRAKPDTMAFKQTAAFIELRDKDEKRRQQAKKSNAVQDFQQMTDYFEARSARRKAKQTGLLENLGEASPVVEDGDSEQERRRRRKERKAAKKAGAAVLDGLSVQENATTAVSDAEEAARAKAARKAERKRGKEQRNHA